MCVSAFPSAFSADGALFATGGESGVVTVWDVALHQPAYQFTISDTAPTSITWSPDSKHIGGAFSLITLAFPLSSCPPSCSLLDKSG